MEYNTFTQKNYKLKTYKERLDLKKKNGSHIPPSINSLPKQPNGFNKNSDIF